MSEELKILLDRAVQSLEVRGRGQLSRRYSVESYGQALREIRQRHAPDLRFTLMQCDIEILDRTSRTNLLHFLRTALSEHIHKNRIQTAIIKVYGGLSSGFDIDELAKKLLQLAVALGSGKASDLFTKSLEEECEFKVLTLLGGVRVDTPVELYDSVRLIPLSQNETDLPGYLPAMFRHLAPERFRGSTLIMEDWVVSPRYMNPEAYLAAADWEGNTPFRYVHKSTEMPTFNAFEFCNALSMVVKTRVFPSVSWRFVSEDEIANLWGIGSGSSWMPDPEPERRTTVTGQQIQEARRVYASLTGLNPDDRVRLSVPIDRLIASWGGKGYVDQIIDLAIALESLYLPESGGELSYRLRNRGARFLGTDLAERKALAVQLTAFYKARSKAVHTGKIPDTHKVGGQRVKTIEFIGMTQKLCLRSIRQVLDGGFPDWETLELG